MAHLQKQNNKIEFEFMFNSFLLSPSIATPGWVEEKRIMMFVSMVNSRFYVHVFPLVKLPLQKLLLFLIIGGEWK